VQAVLELTFENSTLGLRDDLLHINPRSTLTYFTSLRIVLPNGFFHLRDSTKETDIFLSLCHELRIRGWRTCIMRSSVIVNITERYYSYQQKGDGMVQIWG